MEFNLKLLASDILSKRTKENISFGDVLKSHGIRKGQLHYLEAEKGYPNVITLGIVLDWLGKDANRYFIPSPKKKAK